MRDRVANINMLHHSGLAGMECGICVSLGIEDFEYHDDIIYSAMIQAGVQQFRICGQIPQKLRTSKYLANRIVEAPFNDIHELSSRFQKALYEDCDEKKLPENAFSLTWFLAELVYSLQTKSSAVTILPHPRLSDYSNLLSPKAMSAISSLMAKINRVELDLPITRAEVPLKDVKIFSEIISSDLYDDYVQSQCLLDSTEENSEKVGKIISSKGKRLYNQFDSVIDIRKSSVSLIQVSFSLIDAIFGGLPEKLASTVGNALIEAMNDKRRITIYNYGDAHRRLLLDYYTKKVATNEAKVIT